MQADVIDIAWEQGGRFERTLSIAPGRFAELCGALSQGQSVAWSFESDGALNFNIHYHVGKEVKYPSQMDQVRATQGELTTTSAQHYCWMWVNKSAPTTKIAVTLAMK